MRIGLLILALACIGYACNKDDSLTSPTKLTIRMTDNPVAFEEVNIDLQKVYVFSEVGKDSFELGTNAGVYNLLEYQNGLDTLIATATLTADTLKEVRLVLGENNTVLLDGESFGLKTPSAHQSGLKIKVNQPLADIDEYNLLLDFDAEKSVVVQGNGQYLLKPVIKVMK